jgi:surface protein
VEPFITTWEITADNQTLTLPLNGTYNFQINRGDGENVGELPSENVGELPVAKNVQTIKSAVASHTYATSGVKTTTIRPNTSTGTADFPTLYCAGPAGCKQLRSIEQWGDVTWATMNNSFRGTSGLVINATDTPNLSNVTDMTNMFYQSTNLTGNFSGWDTSNITTMQNLFYQATNFDQDLSSRVVTKVANFTNTLYQTQLSLFNYNALLDSWSKQNVPTALTMTRTPLQYGGCVSNAQAGIEGHARLLQPVADGGKAWVLTDGGIVSCGEEHYTMRPFLTTWVLPSDNATLYLPTDGVGYDAEIDWDVAKGSGYTQRVTGTPGNISHKYTGYPAGSEVQISIRGAFPAMRFNAYDNAANQGALRSVDQWGDLAWRSMYLMFYNAKNLTIKATDTPNLTNVLSMLQMFQGATNLKGNFSGWDTSRITNMQQMFNGATNFNQPLASWDTSNVRDMSYMFQSATSFNQPLAAWDTSNVTTMYAMFNGATSFNQPLASWDTSNVTTMRYLFQNASSFNQPLSGWNTEKVTDMRNLFQNAVSFNQDLSSWRMPSLAYAATMLTDSNLSTSNYNATLAAWAAYPDTKNSIAFGASPAQYGGCPSEVSNAEAGIAGRATLVQPTTEGGKGWTITDG